jgi:hypothetical protein
MLIHSFFPVFTMLLDYVYQVPQAELMTDCFTFLSIAAQFIPQFRFTSEFLRLLIDVIGKVEGSDPSLSTRRNFIGLLTGATTQRVESMFLIKHSVFIPLVIMAYRRSPQLTETIEYFSHLCLYSSSNCVACHEGDLDFLLLEVLSHRNHSFEFYGHLLCFEIDDSVAFPAILSLVSIIMKVKTSTVIVDKLIQLTVPGSPAFYPEYADSVLDRLNRAISADSHRRSPVFEMSPVEKQCELSGLTASMLNNGFTVSFWLNIDTPQMLHMNEVFYILRLICLESGFAFRVFVNNGNLFVRYVDAEGSVAGCFFSSIPANVWTPFTLSVEHETEDRSIVNFFKVRQGASPPPYPRITFPGSEVKLVIGGVDHPEHAIVSAGMIGPFAFRVDGSDLMTFLNFPFDSDPNFEHFKEATFTSDLINHPHSNSRFTFEVFHPCYRNDFFEVITNDYTVDYMGCMLQIFRNEHVACPPAFLKMILGFLSYSTTAQSKFLSVPCLAQVLPSIMTLNYQVYSMFFTFLSGCLDLQLLHEMLDYILLNIEIWMTCDLQSMTRILHHWSSAILATFQTSFLRKWTVRRLLAVFVILFFSDVEQNVPCESNDTGIQVDLAANVRERASIHSFSLFHSAEETQQCRALYQQYIVAVGHAGLSSADVESLYSHLFTAQNPDESIAFMTLLLHFGKKITSLTDLTFNPIAPLQQFLQSDDHDLVLATVLAISELAGRNVHFVLSVMSIQQPKLHNVFAQLLHRVPEFPNLFSLICVLALAAGDREKEEALDHLEMISADQALRDVVVSCQFSWIWPLALGLVSDFHGQEQVANFVSFLILQKPDFLRRFESVLYAIWLLANDSHIQADSLSAIVTTVLCRDLFLR